MRILVVGTGFIGDCVMLAQAFSRVRAADPSHTIDWVVGKEAGALLDTKELVDCRFVLGRVLSSRSLRPKNLIARTLLIRRLRRRKYDLALDFDGRTRAELIAKAAGEFVRVPKVEYWFDREGYRAPDSVMLEHGSVSPHWVDVCSAILSHYVKVDLDTPTLMPAFAEAAKRLRSLLNPSLPLATISVGATLQPKRYPIGHWTEVGEALAAKGFQVVFLGGANDPHPDANGSLDLVGKTSLEETVSLIAQSQVHLAADTGTGHIAAAYGAPVVSIFGPTDPLLCGPYASFKHVLSDRRGVELISSEAIVEAALGLAKTKATKS